MSAGQGIKIEERGDKVYLIGALNEYGDLSSLITKPAPLTLNLKGVSRINSIGVRNFLKFLSGWGDKALKLEECTVEFIDQVNMIPSLLGVKQQAEIISLHIPYECGSCDHEGEILTNLSDADNYLKSNNFPQIACSSCGASMNAVTDSYFTFLKK